jgi:hypothetical protein
VKKAPDGAIAKMKTAAASKAAAVLLLPIKNIPSRSRSSLNDSGGVFSIYPGW